MVEKFCRTAHLEEFKDKEDRKKKMKKQCREVQKYQLEKLEHNIGKKDLLEDYKDIYKETKGNPYYVADEEKEFLSHMDKCLTDSPEEFYVSIIKYALSFVQNCYVKSKDLVTENHLFKMVEDKLV